ncbi:MAG: ketopantoate reductase family protein [Candidatus Melainabacteria bacterium]|nr:ketopantoate reductase family protein [Candidatus Melainabacteria bacterium]
MTEGFSCSTHDNIELLVSHLKLDFVVLGMGAVGGFYGLRLAKYLQDHPGEFDLSFVARGKTLTALQQGAVLDDCGTSYEFKDLQVVEKFTDLKLNPEKLTVVLLCVKSKDTIEAASSILGDPDVPFLTSFAQGPQDDSLVVLSVQNGVENEERIASVLGEQKVIGALTNIAAEVIEPGHYLNKGKYSLVLGELDGKLSERVEAIAAVFKAAGINAKVSQNIYKQLWSKLVWNAGFNPTSVLYNMTVGQLLERPEIRERIIGVMQEVVAVAAGLGYQLADDVVESHVARTDVPEWYEFRTSMLQDFQKGKEIELDDLLGVVVRKGKELGLDVPHASKLYADLQAKLQ